VIIPIALFGIKLFPLIQILVLCVVKKQTSNIQFLRQLAELTMDES
jgi:hypothetical protein